MYGDFDITSKNVAMRLFIHSFEGEALKWYQSLPNKSIMGWDTLMQSFRPRFRQEKSIFILVKELST